MFQSNKYDKLYWMSTTLRKISQFFCDLSWIIWNVSHFFPADGHNQWICTTDWMPNQWLSKHFCLPVNLVKIQCSHQSSRKLIYHGKNTDSAEILMHLCTKAAIYLATVHSRCTWSQSFQFLWTWSQRINIYNRSVVAFQRWMLTVKNINIH